MIGRRRRWLAMLFVALALGGCDAARVFIASPGDYADYRRVRLASTLDERLAATWYYLKARPDGRYAERLHRYFDRAEPLFYRVRQRTVAGLEAYLDALPDGPHAAEAGELCSVLRLEAVREELGTRKAREASLRLDVERQRRAAGAGLLTWWLGALLDPALWNAPFTAAPAPVLTRYSLALPQPECQADDPEPGYRRCGKVIVRSYRLRTAEGPEERSVTMELELVLDPSWKLVSASLSGHQLLVRSEEAQSGRPLDRADANAAREAARRFVGRLTKELFAAERVCNGGTDDSGVTILECEGVVLSIAPGAPSGDDLVWVQPARSATEGVSHGPGEEPYP